CLCIHERHGEWVVDFREITLCRRDEQMLGRNGRRSLRSSAAHGCRRYSHCYRARAPHHHIVIGVKPASALGALLAEADRARHGLGARPGGEETAALADRERAWKRLAEKFLI